METAYLRIAKTMWKINKKYYQGYHLSSLAPISITYFIFDENSFMTSNYCRSYHFCRGETFQNYRFETLAFCKGFFIIFSVFISPGFHWAQAYWSSFRSEKTKKQHFLSFPSKFLLYEHIDKTIRLE